MSLGSIYVNNIGYKGVEISFWDLPGVSCSVSRSLSEVLVQQAEIKPQITSFTEI